MLYEGEGVWVNPLKRKIRDGNLFFQMLYEALKISEKWYLHVCKI